MSKDQGAEPAVEGLSLFPSLNRISTKVISDKIRINLLEGERNVNSKACVMALVLPVDGGSRLILGGLGGVDGNDPRRPKLLAGNEAGGRDKRQDLTRNCQSLSHMTP